MKFYDYFFSNKVNKVILKKILKMLLMKQFNENKQILFFSLGKKTQSFFKEKLLQ